jgi:hypothetical protein
MPIAIDTVPKLNSRLSHDMTVPFFLDFSNGSDCAPPVSLERAHQRGSDETRDGSLGRHRRHSTRNRPPRCVFAQMAWPRKVRDETVRGKGARKSRDASGACGGMKPLAEVGKHGCFPDQQAGDGRANFKPACRPLNLPV